MANRRKGKRIDTPDGYACSARTPTATGSVYRQADGRWCATWWVPARSDLEGRRQDTTGSDRPTSEAPRTRPGLDLGALRTVGGLADWWLHNVHKHAVRPSSWAKAEDRVRRIGDPRPPARDRARLPRRDRVAGAPRPDARAADRPPPPPDARADRRRSREARRARRQPGAGREARTRSPIRWHRARARRDPGPARRSQRAPTWPPRWRCCSSRGGACPRCSAWPGRTSTSTPAPRRCGGRRSTSTVAASNSDRPRPTAPTASTGSCPPSSPCSRAPRAAGRRAHRRTAWQTHTYEGDEINLVFTTPAGAWCSARPSPSSSSRPPRPPASASDLATHAGRRTVVTTLFVDGDEALEDIARFVGHAKPATTAGYVKRLGRRPEAVAKRAAAVLDAEDSSN